MSMPVTLRLDRLQEALVGVLDAAVGADAEVGWAYGEALWGSNFPSAQCVNLTMLGGPTQFIRNHARGSAVRLPTSLLLTVDSASAGVRYRIQINDFTYFHDALLADSVTDIRDALLGWIQGDTESPYTAAASGIDGITVTPAYAGAVWQTAVSQLISADVTGDDAYLVTRGTRTMAVSMGCFSRGRSPRDGAWALASRVESAFERQTHADFLAAYGVGVWGKGPAVDLSTVDNGHWLSRVQFDVTFAMQSVFTTAIDTIESLDYSVSLLQPSVTVAGTAP